MSKPPKEDTSPATKADITLVLERLTALRQDVETSKRAIDKVDTDLAEHRKAFADHQTAFAKHEAVMHAQFKTVLDLMDESFADVRENFTELIEKLDQGCYNKTTEQDTALRNHERRLRVLERRVGVPS